MKIKKVIQSEINIGVVGHVDHGKTTLVKALTGQWADKHSEEIKRGITIRLGYADTSIYYCEKSKKYVTKEEDCEKGEKAKFKRKISFVDCPGHETLMAVTMSGASLMDGAILVIAANEPCPQPQTKEHLQALNISGIKNIIIVQNKIDTVTKKQAEENYNQIKEFLKGSIAEKAPIIPVSSNYKLNLDELLAAIEEKIPTPKRNEKKKPKMLIARSFDINKPNSEIKNLKGGVVGGSIIQGKLRVGDEVVISPGAYVKGEYLPLKTKIVSLSTSEGLIKEAHPGGLIGVGTTLDPSLTKGDNLIGNIIELKGSETKPRSEITIDYHLFEKYKGDKLKEGELLVINAGTTTTIGTITKIDKKHLTLKLKKPICSEKGEKIAISKKTTRWTLIGYGELTK